jgi:VCBS repeat-containing protein
MAPFFRRQSSLRVREKGLATKKRARKERNSFGTDLRRDQLPEAQELHGVRARQFDEDEPAEVCPQANVFRIFATYIVEARVVATASHSSNRRMEQASNRGQPFSQDTTMKVICQEPRLKRYANKVALGERFGAFVRRLCRSVAETVQERKRRRRKRGLAARVSFWRELQHVFALESLEARLCLTPVATDDSYQGNSSGTTNIPASVGVLANDTGSSLSAILVSGPSHGSVTLNSDGSFVYSNYMPMSPDTFTYKDYDGTNYSNTATVSLSLSYNGAQPRATADSSYQVVHDHTLNVAASGVLSNDSDPNSIPLTAVLDSSTSHGSLTLNSNGSFSYTPNTHYTGTDTFTYHAYNGYQSSSTVSDTISVNNHAPTAYDDHYYPNDGSTLTVNAASGVLAQVKEF